MELYVHCRGDVRVLNGFVVVVAYAHQSRGLVAVGDSVVSVVCRVEGELVGRIVLALSDGVPPE